MGTIYLKKSIFNQSCICEHDIALIKFVIAGNIDIVILKWIFFDDHYL